MAGDFSISISAIAREGGSKMELASQPFSSTVCLSCCVFITRQLVEEYYDY